MVLKPMTMTFCRSSFRLLAVLAVAASLVPMSEAIGATSAPLLVAKGAASEFGELVSNSARKKIKDGFERARDVAGLVNDHLDDIKERMPQPAPAGARGNPPSGYGYVVDTGNQRFSVSGIDIDSPVTRTGMCVAGARQVLCGDQPCRQLHGGRPLPNCVTGAELCPSNDPQAPHLLLQQGKATLSLGLTPISFLSLIFACSLEGGPFAGGAVLGLGRTGTLARTFGTFSYVLSDRQRQADAVWLGGGTAQQSQRGKPIPLIVNSVYPDRYYVQITSVLVGGQPLQIPPGALDIRPSDRTGGVYLSTTLPVGIALKGEVFELLKAALQNSLGAPDVDRGWLCFAGATLPPPTITLVFANDAVMPLQPGGSVWYPRKNGGQCLAVERSLTGETILGRRVQMGRLMTYNLAANADNVFGTGTVTL